MLLKIPEDQSQRFFRKVLPSALSQKLSSTGKPAPTPLDVPPFFGVFDLDSDFFIRIF